MAFLFNSVSQNLVNITFWKKIANPLLLFPHSLLFLLQVVESGGKNIEIAVMTRKDGLRQLEEAEIDEYVAEIEAEKAAAEAAKKGGSASTSATKDS